MNATDLVEVAGSLKNPMLSEETLWMSAAGDADSQEDVS